MYNFIFVVIQYDGIFTPQHWPSSASRINKATPSPGSSVPGKPTILRIINAVDRRSTTFAVILKSITIIGEIGGGKATKRHGVDFTES